MTAAAEQRTPTKMVPPNRKYMLPSLDPLQVFAVICFGGGEVSKGTIEWDAVAE